MKIVLATSNPGKVSELKEALLDFEIIAQSEFSFEDAEETALSFVENAIIKARHASLHTGLPAIADDSGIEVSFLNGAPGIYSARFAGTNANARLNNEKLIASLVGVSNRKARFRCVAVYMAHANDPSPIIAQGSWDGEILKSFKGENGFGYDPIFYVPEYKCSAAELSFELKNKISHRAKAINELKQHLKQVL